MKKNIAIIGIGGVGGYFGGKIAYYLKNSNEYNVYFIARGKHLEEIKKNGLLLKTSKDGDLVCKPYLCTDNFSELPALDICLICVKQYSLNEVLLKLSDKITDNTKIVPLLNGVDVYSRIRKVIKKGTIFPACVYVGTHIDKPGVVCQSGGSCTIIFGKDPENLSSNAADICSIFDKCSINYKWTEEHFKEIWGKFMFIASYGLVTAYYNMTLGEVYNDKECSNVVKKVMNIIYEISESENINLNKDIIELSYEKANNFPFETKTSFQRDFENKEKSDERELFGKAIIELGKKNNINVDIVEELYKGLNKLKSIE